MSKVNKVEVNVNVGDENDRPAQGVDGKVYTEYEEGMVDGWFECACEVLERIEENCDDPDRMRNLLFPMFDQVLEEGSSGDELLDYILDDAQECGGACRRSQEGCDDSNSVSAWELDKDELGRRGEDAATRYLERSGFEILARNWKCRFGEADIIAEDEDGSVVFIEVKTRRSEGAGCPEESITRAKQRKYESIALCYLTEKNWESDTPVRFDAIGILVNGSNHAILRHHKGCFDADR